MVNALDLAECRASLRRRQLNDWRVTLHSPSYGSRFVIWNPEGKAIAVFARYTSADGWWWSHIHNLGFGFDRHYCYTAVEAMNRAIRIWRTKSAQ